MNNLNIYFDVGFGDRRITNNRFFQFAYSSVERLKNNNTNGQFDQLILDTEGALLAFRDAMVREKIELGERQAQTKRLNEIAAGFVQEVRKRASYILGLDSTDPGLYEAFFPNGLSEVGRLTRANEQQVILRFAGTAQKYASVVGAQLAAEFNQLFQLYETARAAQENQKAAVDSLRAETAARRKALEVEIGKNVLTLGKEYYGEPQIAEIFFRQELLFRRNPNGSDDGIEGELQPNAVTEIPLPLADLNATDELSLSNTGFAPLIFYMADKPDEVDEADGLLLLSGEQITVKAVRLGPAGNRYFNVKNMSEDLLGSFEVRVL